MRLLSALSLTSLIVILGFSGCSKQDRTGGNPKEGRKFALSSLKTTQLSIDGHSFRAWVMDTEEKRQEGLMYVQASELADNQAMLFVFDEPGNLSFWMEHTEIPLDIAYFGADKKLLNVRSGIPFKEDPLPSAGEAQYVVETNSGVFSKLAIKKGAPLVILSDAK